jgi:hypothetical protein
MNASCQPGEPRLSNRHVLRDCSQVVATPAGREALESSGLGLKCRSIVSQNRSLVASGGQPEAESVPTKTKSNWQIDPAAQSHDDSRPSVNSDCLVSHSNLYSGVGGSAAARTILFSSSPPSAKRHHCAPRPTHRLNRAAQALMPPFRLMK